MREKIFIKIVLILVTLLSASSAASAQTSVTLVTDPWPPYVIGNDGESPTGGVSVEIVRKIFERLEDVKLEMKLYPWKRALNNAVEGEADGIWMVMKNEERMKVLEFTEPLLESRAFYWYLRSRYPDGIKSEKVADLLPYRIGVVRGYEIAKPLYEAQKQGIQLKIDDVTSEKQNFLKLVNNRVDIIPSHETVAYEQIKQNGWKDILAHTEKPIETTVFYIGFSKKSPAKSLIPKINKILGQLKTDGTVDRILQMTKE